MVKSKEKEMFEKRRKAAIEKFKKQITEAKRVDRKMSIKEKLKEMRERKSLRGFAKKIKRRRSLRELKSIKDKINSVQKRVKKMRLNRTHAMKRRKEIISRMGKNLNRIKSIKINFRTVKNNL